MSLLFTVLSFNVFATSNDGVLVTVPYPTNHQSYFGGIRKVEKQLKADLMEKAAVVCRTKEKVSTIANVEVKIAFSLIELDNEQFEGSYPLGSVTAEVYCSR